MAAPSSIRPLPADVLSQIRSSVTIASLNDVVLNLVKNSLDSNASSIEVAVDYSRGSCTVDDNGLGIESAEFSERGGLGKLYHTSKSYQCVKTHGGRGSFIALLSALCLIAITSHHHQHRSHNTLTMHRSKVIARQIPAPAEHRISDRDHGTRVTVRDLFGSMPVRVRQRASEPAANEKEWQNLRKSIVGLLLAWSCGVSITVRNVISSQNMKIRSAPDGKERRKLDVSHFCSILSQAMLITPSDKEFWVSTTGSTSNLVISGTMSTEPCPHKNVQFLSFHVHPIADCNGSNFLYDHINRLFTLSSFGNEEEDEPLNDQKMAKRSADARYKQDGYTSKQLKSSKKGSDRWPMFCLRIESTNGVSSLAEDAADEFLYEKSGHLASIMDLLEAIVVGFLKEHHFRIEPRNRGAGRTRFKENHPTRHPQVVNQKVVSKSKLARSRDLGTEIKLPSFSRALLDSSESAFSTWTRIKRGQIETTQKEVDTPTASRPDGIYLQEGNPSAAESAFSLAPTKSSQEKTAGRFFAPGNKRTKFVESSKAKTVPLIDSKGKVSRLPFQLESYGSIENNITENIATKPGDNGIELQMPLNDIETSGDDLIAWIDPVSKDKSLICRRTGLIVPPEKLAPISNSNFSLNNSNPRNLTPRIRPILRTTGRAREEPSTWISSLLNSWGNPVFQPAELPIPQLSIEGPNIESQQILHGRRPMCTHSDVDKAFRQSWGGLAGRLSKDALRNVEVVSQVDKKFILIKMSTMEKQGHLDGGRNEPTILVLVDQHAADERCRVEELFHELCTNSIPLPLETPIIFDISELEFQLFRRYRDHFKNWGISYEVPDVSKATFHSRQVMVKGLPSVIIERCRIDPKVLVKLMRVEIWKVHHRGDGRQLSRGALQIPISDEPTHDWFTRLRECPEGLVDILNSRSCRSAIMFNDELSAEQCESLISRLARCAFPFQCAHGRPSMIPLIDLSTILQNPMAMPVFGGKDNKP